MPRIDVNLMKTLTWHDFGKIISDDPWLHDPDIRLVHLSDSTYRPSLSDFERVLCGKSHVKDVLTKSQYLFGLIVHARTIDESSLDSLQTEIRKVFIDSGKYFFIEFYSDNDSDSFVDNVRYVFNQQKVTKYRQRPDNSGSNINKQNDELWLNVFDKSLLKFYFLNDEICEECIKKAVDDGDSLSVRILKSFNAKVKISSEKKILERLVTKNHEVVRAFLNLPIVEGNNENSISPTPLTERTKIFKYKFNKEDTVCNRSLLCVAVQGNELDVVKLLLRLGFDIYEVVKEKTVTDYCQNLEILKFLLNNDAKFPVDFSKKFESWRHCSGSQKDIFDIADDRLQLHAAIKKENTEAILTFRKKYPNLRMAYMHMDTAPYNQSATMTSIKHALQSKSADSDFRFYAILFSYGFRDDHEEIADLRMATGSQEKISKILLNKLLHDQSDHIGYLRNKTKIGTVVHHGTDNNDYQKRVDAIYERIKDIGGAEVNSVLKVLQHSQSLTIVIDFHSKYVNPMCPLMNKLTDGITYQNEGHIYVGAGGKTEMQIAATLVHELCHFAIHITFDNACNPYYANDHVNANTMSDIVDQIRDCRQQIHIECGSDVITSVFDYDETLWPRELIVRVPEMIMMEKRHLLDDEKYKILVDYLEKPVLSTIKSIVEESEDFRLRRDVEQLNGYLGIVERIKCFKNEGIWPNKKRLPEIPNSCSLVCSIPNLMLADVYENLIGPTLISAKRPVNEQATNNYYILASLGDFDSPTKKRRILLTWMCTIDVTLILNCENYKKSFLQHSDFFEELNKSRKIILIGSNEKHLLEIAPNSSLCRVQYDWTDIAEEQIKILFLKEINFQEVNVALYTLIGNDCDVISLEKLINDSQIKVEAFKVSIDNYDESQYVDRRFQTYENVDHLLLDESNDRKTLLLSDVSGSGKSIIFSRICRNIKEKRQGYWVSRINLHEWGETFQCMETSDMVTQLTNILVRTDVKMDKQFQEKLFEKLYQDSRVILLFDAYDELPSQYRKDFQNLVKKLNTNIQIWISTRPQFETRLHELLEKNFVPLKLIKFSYDDIYHCVMKFWQNFIQKSEAESKLENFDDIRSGANFLLSKYIQEPAVESKLKRYAVEMISLFTDSVKKFVLQETFLQPSIVIILAEYYQQYVKDFIFSESKHFTIDSYIDIFDLYKLIVTKKYMILYRQKGLGIAVETAEDLIFQDVGGYLEHLALKSKFGPKVVDYYDNFIDSKYEYCDTVETDDESLVGRLQRSGLISFSDDLYDNKIYFIDDSVCDYFVAVFVIKKLRRATSAAPSIDQSGFAAAMKILCINIIEPTRDDLTLLTFIDEGIKRFWDLFSDRVFVVCNTYFNKTPEITFNYDSFEYLLRKNAIFLLNYFFECFTASTSTKFEISGLEGLLKIASGIGVFSVVEMFWYHKKLRKLVSSEHIRDAFRAAFMFFPESKVGVVRDNMNFHEVKDAFMHSEFNKSLQKIIEENFNNSTLYNLVSMCEPIQDTSELVNKRRNRHLVRIRAIINGRVLNPRSELVPCPTVSHDHLNELIEFEGYNSDAYDCDIKIDFFEAYIEMKWLVLEELKYPASCWKDVVNQTLFGTVVAKIFDNFDNILVFKFYKWAHSKEKLRDSFKDFVEDTIVRHFYRCELKPGVDELFQFIRQTLAIDIETVFQRHGLSKWLYVARFLPICMKFFTNAEFTAFLTASYDGDENVLVYILKSKSSDLVDFVLAIHHFQNSDVDIMDTIENACDTIKSDDDDMLKTINRSIIKTLSARISDGQGKLAFNLLMNFVKNLFSDSVIRDALRSFIRFNTLEYTIFHDACCYSDMDVMNGVWHIARQHYLTVDEWRGLLMFTNDRVKNTIIKENDSRFIENPPTLYNTFCAASAYQFIPFDRFNIKIPYYAVSFKVDTDRSTFIGRMSNKNGDQLCQICFDGTKFTEIKPIPDDANIAINIDLNGNEFEILTVKGVEWSHFKTNGVRFLYKNRALRANEHGLITLEDKFERRNNGYNLIFDSSFKDNMENENIIYYKYDKY